MNKWVKRFAPAVLISIVVTVLMVVAYQRGSLDGFEARIFNSKMVIRGQMQRSDKVVIATIDDYCLDRTRLGRWPWPRAYIGMLIEALNKNEAKIIGFDVFFPEEDTNVPIYGMRAFLRTNFELRGLDQPEISGAGKAGFLTNLQYFYDILLGAEFERNPDADKEGDDLERDLNPDNRLAQVLSKYDNVILGYFFGEAEKPEVYIEKIETTFLGLEKTFEDAGLAMPPQAKNDKDQMIIFLKDIQSREKKLASVEALQKQVTNFSKNFKQTAKGANSISDNYQGNIKSAMLSFYSNCTDILDNMSLDLLVTSDNPEDQVLEAISKKFQGMEGSAVKYDKPAGTINPFLHANDMIPNIPLFTNNTKHFGHVFVQLDQDGVIRHHFPLIHYGKQLFPSLGINAASLMMKKIPNATMPSQGDRPQLDIGGAFIPLEKDGTLLINYFGPEKYPQYSIYDIMYDQYQAPMMESVPKYFKEVQKTTPEEFYKKYYGREPEEGDIGFMVGDAVIDEKPLSRLVVEWEAEADFKNKYGITRKEAFKDKVVLVGSTAIGAHDLRVTPFSENSAGVEIHAAVIDSVLTGKFLHTPVWARSYTLGFMVIFAVIMVLLLPMMSVLYGAVLTFAILCGLIAFDYFLLFRAQGLCLPISYQINHLGVLFLLVTIYRYATEEREKRFIKDTFGRYLAPSVIEHLTENPELLQLGGEELELTAFFSDIQGFSTISEKLGSAKRLVDLLNDYLSEMAHVIEEYEGTIDKYEGDAIIAFWGAPLHFPDHAEKACLACLDQQSKLDQLREKWKKEAKWPEIVLSAQVRMGINTGSIVVGNMGSAGRMNYTIMGDAVNLAARLEGANKVYGTFIMVAQDTYKAVKDKFEFRELDRLRVVGKTEPVSVYQLISRKGDISPQQMRVVEVFLEGIESYKRMDWQKAIESFQTALNIDPNDGPSKTYLKRCQGYLTNPPGDDWDGVFSLTSK